MKKAVVLLSGGLDSATTLYLAKRRGFTTYCLIFDYGQRHHKEIKRAFKIADLSKSQKHLVKITLPWKGSALLDKKLPLPQNRRIIPSKIPSTYVPARNIIFLSLAASLAETIGARDIFIGANALDYSGYPDCRPDFYKSFQQALKQGLKAGVEKRPLRLQTPLIHKTKAQIVKLAFRLKVPLAVTWSCYRGGRKPCGTCDSCLLRKKGFDQAQLKDPAA